MRQQQLATHRLGGAMANVIVGLVCVAILGSLVIIMNPRRHGVPASLSRDSTQIRGIHQAWLIFAREFNDRLPTPGLIDRLPFNGIEEPGRGLEDTAKNTTANLFSACVMLNYISPELCVGPTETNPVVRVFRNYNFAAYAPARGVGWDSNFKADLHGVSHVSYAHMPLIPIWSDHWSGSADDSWPIAGNRGPLDGMNDPKSYTFGLHEPYDRWSGNICFADNHMEFHVGLKPAERGGGKTLDVAGVFRRGGTDDPDGLLTFTKAMTEAGPEIQHD